MELIGKSRSIEIHYYEASRAELFAALDREQPVQSGFNGSVTGGCSRPVSFALTTPPQVHFGGGDVAPDSQRLPAVEPGILPGGIAVPQAPDAPPGGRMPPSTAGKMPAATWWQRPGAPPRRYARNVFFPLPDAAIESQPIKRLRCIY